MCRHLEMDKKKTFGSFFVDYEFVNLAGMRGNTVANGESTCLHLVYIWSTFLTSAQHLFHR
jgi:hypothetical protein